MGAPFSARVVDILDAIALPSELVGGKARGLALLGSISGTNVPRGFVVTSQNFAEFIEANPLQPSMEVWTAALRARDAHEAAKVGRAIRNTILSGVMPKDVLDSLQDAYTLFRRTVGEGVPLIVRSSAVGEDSLLDSQAGLYHSAFPVLNFEQLVSAIRRIWASAFSWLVRRHWLSKSTADLGDSDSWRAYSAMAVVVQELIPATCSGVAFSRDPRNGGDAIMIEVVRGLGEQLVSGLQTPQHWLFNYKGVQLLEKRLVPQASGRVYSPRLHRLVTRKWPPRNWLDELLDEEKARTIATTMHRIAQQCHDWPGVDAEFVIDASNHPFQHCF